MRDKDKKYVYNVPALKNCNIDDLDIVGIDTERFYSN